ncbi:peptidase M50 [Streptomyces gamaensis]|uniref:Peptidase M50 n=1 Tax=Streptomyces gamaensis TaxID=1763542 RepID=A0ABW0YZ61_9ACTN
MTAGKSVLLEQRPALRAEVLLSAALRRGTAMVHLVKDPGSGQSFEVGVKEHFLMSRLDGSRTLAGIGEEYARHFGRRLGEANWRQLLGLLGERGLLEGADPPTREPEQRPRATFVRGTLRLSADPARTVDRLHRAVGFVFSAPCAVPLVLLTLAMEATVALRPAEFASGAGELLRQPVLLLGALTLLWVSTALHELAHGVVARRFGGSVTEIGLHWRLPVVFMYCKVDNYPYLPTRWAKVATAGAGMFANLVFLLPFALARSLLPDGAQARGPLAGLLLLGSVLALTNLVPVPPLDGYKALSHALGMTDYAAQSRRFLRLLCARAVGHGPGAAGYPRGARIAYAAYGLGVTALACGAVVGLAVLAHHLLTRG